MKGKLIPRHSGVPPTIIKKYVAGKSESYLMGQVKKQKAFTLIETLIYIGIFSIVALSLSGILWNTLRINSNQQAANEVDENLRYVLSVLNEKVRSSVVIDSATSSTLILKNGSYVDTTFSVTGEVLYLQEGAGTPIAVTSNKVKVDSLTFSKIEMSGAKDGVSVDITLSYNSDKPELAFTKNLISMVNRVAAITFDSDILPDTDNLYSVGSSNPRWKNGYFSGNLDIDGTLSTTAFQLGASATSGYVLTTDASGIGSWQPSSIGLSAGYVPYTTSTGALTNSGLYWDNSNQRLGVGTTTPSSPLVISYDKDSATTMVLLNSHSGTAAKAQIAVGQLATGANYGLFMHWGTGFATNGLQVANRTGLVGYDTAGIVMMTGTANGSLYLGTNLIERMSFSSSGNIVINEGSYDADIRIEGDNNANLFYVDAGNDKLGVGTTTPSEILEVNGNIRLVGTTPTYKIKNVATPTDSSDVATKGYVDSVASSSLVAFRYVYDTTCPTVTGVTLRVVWYWDDLYLVNSAGTDCGSRKACVCYYSSL